MAKKTNRQVLDEIQVDVKKLLARGATPTGPGGTMSNTTPKPPAGPVDPADLYMGPNAVIPPGNYWPLSSGMRPDGFQWRTQEEYDTFIEVHPDLKPKCEPK